MRLLLTIIFIISVSFAEYSISLGQVSGRYLETVLTDSQNARRTFQNLLPGRPALFIEFDSLKHPLWLSNDQVIFGLGVFPEAYYQDYFSRYNFQTNAPAYCNYGLRFADNWTIGGGLNLNFMKLRFKNSLRDIGQQIGKQFFIRYTDHAKLCFYEISVLQGCNAIYYQDIDIGLFYNTTNYLFKIGFYLDKNIL